MPSARNQNTTDEGKNMMRPWRPPSSSAVKVQVAVVGGCAYFAITESEGFYRFPHAQLSGLPMSADLAK